MSFNSDEKSFGLLCGNHCRFCSGRWVEVFGFYWTSPDQCTSTGPIFCVPSTGTNGLWSRSLRGRDAWIDGTNVDVDVEKCFHKQHHKVTHVIWIGTGLHVHLAPKVRATFSRVVAIAQQRFSLQMFARYAPGQCETCFLRNHATTLLPMIVCLRCRVVIAVGSWTQRVPSIDIHDLPWSPNVTEMLRLRGGVQHRVCCSVWMFVHL